MTLAASPYDLAAQLPPIDVLRNRCRALAVLENLIDIGEPTYGYTRERGTDEAALMSDGGGDEWAIVFTPGGAFIRVFNHESPLSPYRDSDRELWPGLLDGLPAEFAAQLEEPAFSDEDGQFLATAVLWRRTSDDRWHAGHGIVFPPVRGPYDTDPDGSGMLKILLDDIVDRYVAFAADIHGLHIDRAAVQHIVDQWPLTGVVRQDVRPG